VDENMDLNLSQTQKTTLSTKMIQSTSILQMNLQTLDSYMENLLLENPIIDLIENTAAETETSTFDEYDRMGQSDEQNRIYYKEDTYENDKWNFSVIEEDLYMYVMSQLTYEIKTPKDHEILEFLVYNLNDKGYLELNDLEASEMLEISVEAYQQYVNILQSVEPAGLGARDLNECLALQLNKLNLLPDEIDRINTIIKQHIDAIGKNHIQQIAQKLNISIPELNRYIEIIRKLNPKPANGFNNRENLKYIQPDVIVVKFKDYYEILTTEGRYTEIRLNKEYTSMLNEGYSSEVQTYIKKMKVQAEWVKTCIYQRSKTLTDVVKVMIEYQHAFFETAQGQLKPMRMADVANILQIHESTVSRAVQNKYLQCSRGIYPLNYFFAKQFASASQTSMNVKEMIREIIQNEDKRNPLSDQKIELEMSKRGTSIKRRTIAKYRHSLGISSAEGRKQFT
jgi:RNA polymerase sigma-54 factor